MAGSVLVNRGKGSSHLRVRETNAQRVEQQAQLRFIDLTVAVAIDEVEAVPQWIQAHARRLRRFLTRTKPALLLVAFTFGCRAPVDTPGLALAGAGAAPAAPAPDLHPSGGTAANEVVPSLAPLRAEWLENFGTNAEAVVITPPVGATAPAKLVVGVHGAGDRPDWSCGGWRLAAQTTALVVCPRGSPLSSTTFAWRSPQVLAERVTAAVDVAKAHYEPYIEPGPMIYAGFSQGATFAEPFLRANAARFPIAILAEGGYRTMRSPAFAAAFRKAGGRRIVLVCGTAQCFQSVTSARKLLERAGLEVLIVGDEKAGHNLNERMQHALQSAWPEISAPVH